MVNGSPEEGRILGIKGDELTAVPVGLKLDGKLFEDVPHVLGSHLEIPFQAAGYGRMGHVGRADVGRGKSAVALEVVRLGMKPGSLGVVGDANLDVRHARQPLHRRSIGCPHVGGGDQPHRNMPVTQVLESRHQQAQAGPFDE